MLKLGELSTILSANMDPLKRDLAKAKGYVKEHGQQIKAMGAAAGAALGVAIGAGLLGGLEMDKAQAKLTAQLGNAEWAKELGGIAGNLYTQGFGESADELMQTVRQVMSSGLLQEDATNAEIESVTRSVQALGTAFDLDVGQASRAAGQMVRNGLAKDANEALDIITRGFQQTGDQAGDMLDSFSEYSTQFRKLGLSGQEAMGLMSQGVKAGARDLDVVADGLKEFAIRAANGSKASAKGFEAIGLDAKKMTAIFAAGGPQARDALGGVLEKIKAMKDPTAREAAAVALFGTKAEDLQGALMGMDLSTATDQLGNVAGAAGKVGDALEESSSQKLEAFKRTAQSALTDTMAGAIPHLEKVTNFLSKHSEIIGPLTLGLTAFAAVIMVVRGAMAAWATIQAVMNLALWTSPITWIVLGILLLVGAIIYVATKTQFFQTVWAGVWGFLKGVGAWFAGPFVDFFKGVGRWFAGPFLTPFKAIGSWFSGPFVNFFVSAWNKVKSWTNTAIGWFKSLPGKIRSGLASVGAIITAPFRSAFNAVAGFWNRTVGSLNFSLPGFMGGGGVSMPQIPMLAKGGVAKAAGWAITGEKGPELTYMPQGAGVQPLNNGRLPGLDGAGGPAEVALTGEFTIRGDDLVYVIRKKVWTKAGGNVQRYLGQGAASA